MPILLNNGSNSGRGTLYVKVNVRIPKNLTLQERELYQQLSNLA